MDNLFIPKICYYLLFPSLCITFFACESTPASDQELVEWTALFNGRNIDDWSVKIRGYELHNNYKNTFRVEEGVMKISYDGYERFDDKFGHIFYNTPYAAYLLRVEYRFVGEQAPGGEGWAFRNSGVMLHGQSPASMGLDQDFPISIEGQILGGDGDHPRPTSNLCTPGTHVVMDGNLFTPHCISSTSDTYHGDQWVTADFLVLSDSLIEHRIGGRTVLRYSKPQIGGGNVSGHHPDLKEDGKPLKSGYISLQSESHPVEFRKVELVDLAPFMDDQEKLSLIINELSPVEK
ncbi:3-keto-disaccharide hydrolase [Anditalea andensis]|uniref:3-keto-alpha-glucoside-1,2-lyase/3-keto-2-hydroxy-glucal hydratase domain-containing protein n=1 Tax=Anditalea andensis TaxID=1048983 RepID=A0A074L0F9_9BACT|nr:DUF1080 domain-containing protein [Anditalea andensis]KEO75716.1 hypothetical protein EL17_22070 [Anditalea andensis]